MPALSYDPTVLRLAAGTFGFLTTASGVGFLLGRRTADAGEAVRRTIANLNARLRAWWVIVTLCTLALLFGQVGAAILFGLVSFQALREFVGVIPTDEAEHPMLINLIFTLLQYGFVARGWYPLFSIFPPVAIFLFVPMCALCRGAGGNFLARVATMQWGLMICVYFVSHAPALLSLPVANGGAGLLAFFILVVQLSDVFQYIWGKLLGRHQIAPRLSPSKTWEGLLGGAGTATAVGTALWWVTPFTPVQAAGMSLAITLFGFAGGLMMSAIKRDRGLKDFGTLIEGHGGVLDRIDSVCFAAPAFYYLTRYFFT